MSGERSNKGWTRTGNVSPLGDNYAFAVRGSSRGFVGKSRKGETVVVGLKRGRSHGDPALVYGLNSPPRGGKNAYDVAFLRPRAEHIFDIGFY